MPHFVRDVEELRQRALSKIDEGPVTSDYTLDQHQVISLLNEALATEIVCILRYMHHYLMATGVHGQSIADEFKEHADDERKHADLIGNRLQQLGGKPDFNPGSLVSRSVTQYIEGETLGDMIREDLIAERVVIGVYRDMIRFFGDKDPTTRVMFEGILKDEEDHANDLTDLLFVVDPHTGKDEGVDPGVDALHMEAGGLSMEIAPAHQPGTVGHTNARNQKPQDMTPAEGEHAGSQTGTSRSPHVVKPNRKNRVA
jgi:bacterioferritin